MKWLKRILGRGKPKVVLAPIDISALIDAEAYMQKMVERRRHKEITDAIIRDCEWEAKDRVQSGIRMLAHQRFIRITMFNTLRANQGALDYSLTPNQINAIIELVMVALKEKKF